MTTRPPFVLGIDPGRETGLAAIAAETLGDVAAGAVLFVGSDDPLATVRTLETWAASGRLVGAYIEDARELPIYARHGKASRGERDRIARGVGAVDFLTGMYAELLGTLGVPVALVEPVRAAKWDAPTCARLTGWTAQTNEHGRDALRHVFGRARPRAPGGRDPPRLDADRGPPASTATRTALQRLAPLPDPLHWETHSPSPARALSRRSSRHRPSRRSSRLPPGSSASTVPARRSPASRPHRSRSAASPLSTLAP